MQQVGIVYGVQQVFPLPAALLHGKAQLFANAAGADGILGKQNRIIAAQRVAQAARQRENLRQLDAVGLHAVLGQQILGRNNFLGFGTVADQGYFGTLHRFQHIVPCPCAGQRRKGGLFLSAGIADGTRAAGLTH